MSWKHFWRANNKKNDWTWKKDERTKERRKKHNERFKQTHTERKVQTYKGEKTLQLFVMHSFSITCQTTKVEV